jgi:hypothetical protein
MLKFRDTIRLSRIKSVGVPEKNGFFTGVLIGLAICIPFWGIVFYFIF